MYVHNYLSTVQREGVRGFVGGWGKMYFQDMAECESSYFMTQDGSKASITAPSSPSTSQKFIVLFPLLAFSVKEKEN